ncbi:hypothetical protein LTR64_000207 [Lithohypha guttulata]|uniref:uncharacterized protein n=1 Tax=Lithohypha guttulata TaxID=1690604 RepID=UPI002DDDF46B|nr:hypothetical protein LTR51_007569 [Lithohypha guttulata]
MNGHTAQFNTPNILASEAVLIIHSTVNIDAPAALVFRSLRNTDTWRDWNRFVPKVTIDHQPPEDDHVTAAEIQELVRNTSINGSFYSDLTDGGGNGTRRPRSPDDQPPPRFRLNSISSQMSAGSAEQQPQRSQSVGEVFTNLSPFDKRGSTVSTGSGQQKKSGAQLFQESQEIRRSSIASGQEPPAIVNRVENSDSHRASIAYPSPNHSRRDSKLKQRDSSAAASRAYQSLMKMYGEPSVRLQIGTKMTFHVRMKPMSPSEFTETKMVVIEISRPDDPVNEAGTTALTRSKTHTLDRMGHYRIVWAADAEGASILNLSAIFSGSKMPKYLLQAERVHEIEPTGPESCIYRNWECQKGHAAKQVKKKYGDYLQKMFDTWGWGLKEFCEGLHAPKIARRDFSISADEAPIVIQTLT